MFESLITTYKALREQKEKIEAQMKDLRMEWNDRVLQYGNYTCKEGKITIRDPYVKVSWNNRVLESVLTELVALSPELAQKMASARSETKVEKTYEIR